MLNLKRTGEPRSSEMTLSYFETSLSRLALLCFLCLSVSLLLRTTQRDDMLEAHPGWGAGCRKDRLTTHQPPNAIVRRRSCMTDVTKEETLIFQDKLCSQHTVLCGEGNELILLSRPQLSFAFKKKKKNIVVPNPQLQEDGKLGNKIICVRDLGWPACHSAQVCTASSPTLRPVRHVQWLSSVSQDSSTSSFIKADCWRHSSHTDISGICVSSLSLPWTPAVQLVLAGNCS
ncbi:hypothetical protein INR49_024593 [Caranx melampygus]|nr:hypothetical protein INR49_024593 [Caranx melampygus]